MERISYSRAHLLFISPILLFLMLCYCTTKASLHNSSITEQKRSNVRLNLWTWTCLTIIIIIIITSCLQLSSPWMQLLSLSYSCGTVPCSLPNFDAISVPHLFSSEFWDLPLFTVVKSQLQIYIWQLRWSAGFIQRRAGLFPSISPCKSKACVTVVLHGA